MPNQKSLIWPLTSIRIEPKIKLVIIPQELPVANRMASPNGALNKLETTRLNLKEIRLCGARSTAARKKMKSKAECICPRTTTTRSFRKGNQLGMPLGSTRRRLGLLQNTKQPIPRMHPKTKAGISNC